MLAAVAVLFCVALAGCGGSGSSNQGILQAADKHSVATAEVKLSKAVETAKKYGLSLRYVIQRTRNVVSRLQQARSDGVSRSWIDKEIFSSEGDVELVGCHDCFTALDDAR